MLKAVFLDYTGTIIEEGGADIQEMIMRICRNCDEKSPEKLVGLWWQMLKEKEEESYGDSYRTEDEIVDLLLEALVQKYHLKENLADLHTLVQRFWMYAPAFDDTKEFFSKCSLPIYIISNNGRKYVEEGMRHKGLHPTDIICGDMVKAYKPRRELFEKALEVSGCAPGEAVHIGDSVNSDVKGAMAAGIYPILLDRKGAVEIEGVTVVHSLPEALEVLKNKDDFSMKP